MADERQGEIKPALTPEEWAKLEHRGIRLEPSGAIRMEMAKTILDQEPPFISFGSSWRPGIAALALHGQPFGFTWEIHDAIEAAIMDWETEAGEMDERQRKEFAAMNRGLAAIAALLPPRE